MVKKLICFFLLLSSSTGLAVTPYYSIRSQSENAARELVGAGWNTHINLCDMDGWYGNISVTPEYTRSFKPYHIAQTLFGCFSTCCWSSTATPGCYPHSPGCLDPCTGDLKCQDPHEDDQAYYGPDSLPSLDIRDRIVDAGT